MEEWTPQPGSLAPGPRLRRSKVGGRGCPTEEERDWGSRAEANGSRHKQGCGIDRGSEWWLKPGALLGWEDPEASHSSC